MRKIIINADDLGISLEVDSVIENCIQKGVVTSSTLMANAPAFEDGVRIAKQYPQVSVGVHLNIIEFTPLTNIDIFKRHGIVGDDGFFIEGGIFCVQIDDELRNAVFEEWDAQISRIEAVGIKPSHCDSHQHTHTIPELRETLCKVLEKHSIKRVRRKIVPYICLILREKKRPAIQFDKSKAMVQNKRGVLYRRALFVVNYFRCRYWNIIMSKRFTLTNSFFAFRSFYFDKKVLYEGGRDAVLELMCHPGHKAYDEETELLSRDKSWLPKEYQLISYKDLKDIK